MSLAKKFLAFSLPSGAQSAGSTTTTADSSSSAAHTDVTSGGGVGPPPPPPPASTNNQQQKQHHQAQYTPQTNPKTGSSTYYSHSPEPSTHVSRSLHGTQHNGSTPSNFSPHNRTIIPAQGPRVYPHSHSPVPHPSSAAHHQNSYSQNSIVRSSNHQSNSSHSTGPPYYDTRPSSNPVSYHASSAHYEAGDPHASRDTSYHAPPPHHQHTSAPSYRSSSYSTTGAYPPSRHSNSSTYYHTPNGHERSAPGVPQHTYSSHSNYSHSHYSPNASPHYQHMPYNSQYTNGPPSYHSTPSYSVSSHQHHTSPYYHPSVPRKPSQSHPMPNSAHHSASRYTNSSHSIHSSSTPPSHHKQPPPPTADSSLPPLPVQQSHISMNHHNIPLTSVNEQHPSHQYATENAPHGVSYHIHPSQKQPLPKHITPLIPLPRRKKPLAPSTSQQGKLRDLTSLPLTIPTPTRTTRSESPRDTSSKSKWGKPTRKRKRINSTLNVEELTAQQHELNQEESESRPTRNTTKRQKTLARKKRASSHRGSAPRSRKIKKSNKRRAESASHAFDDYVEHPLPSMRTPSGEDEESENFVFADSMFDMFVDTCISYNDTIQWMQDEFINRSTQNAQRRYDNKVVPTQKDIKRAMRFAEWNLRHCLHDKEEQRKLPPNKRIRTQSWYPSDTSPEERQVLEDMKSGRGVDVYELMCMTDMLKVSEQDIEKEIASSRASNFNPPISEEKEKSEKERRFDFYASTSVDINTSQQDDVQTKRISSPSYQLDPSEIETDLQLFEVSRPRTRRKKSKIEPSFLTPLRSDIFYSHKLFPKKYSTRRKRDSERVTSTTTNHHSQSQNGVSEQSEEEGEESHETNDDSRNSEDTSHEADQPANNGEVENHDTTAESKESTPALDNNDAAEEAAQEEDDEEMSDTVEEEEDGDDTYVPEGTIGYSRPRSMPSRKQNVSTIG